jgi:hypothetical protein
MGNCQKVNPEDQQDAQVVRNLCISVNDPSMSHQVSLSTSNECVDVETGSTFTKVRVSIFGP